MSGVGEAEETVVPYRGRRDLLPAAGVPLLYFAFAHACLALALIILITSPDLPAGFFYHPKMIAVVHLVTLGWISGSILGAFYIVAPLALRMPLRPAWHDRVAFGCFAVGVSGVVSHFWIGEYSGMAWSALFVAVAVLHVAVRAWRGLLRAPVLGAVKLHVALAFANMMLATAFGALIGLNRAYAWWSWPAMSTAFAHAHLAAVGWPMMMVVGLSYRLIPMIVPSEMPKGRAPAASAVLLEAGILGLVAALLAGSGWTFAAALVIVAGIVSFVRQVSKAVRRKLPGPAGLPRPDWATWQTHVAFIWLLVAAVTGLWLALPIDQPWMITLGWIYGGAGLVGFLTQIVIGIQGRLLPMYGWYRLMEKIDMQPPDRPAHSLAHPGLAKGIFATWTAGVPVLVFGLAENTQFAIVAGSMLLLAGLVLLATQTVKIVTAGRRGMP